MSVTRTPATGPKRMRRFATAVGIALLIAACGSSATTSTSSSSASSASSGGPIVIKVSGPLNAGTYSLPAFDPPLQVTLVGTGWYMADPEKTFIAMNLFPAQPDAYVNVFRPTKVFQPPGSSLGPAPADLAAWLR